MGRVPRLPLSWQQHAMPGEDVHALRAVSTEAIIGRALRDHHVRELNDFGKHCLKCERTMGVRFIKKTLKQSALPHRGARILQAAVKILSVEPDPPQANSDAFLLMELCSVLPAQSTLCSIQPSFANGCVL